MLHDCEEKRKTGSVLISAFLCETLGALCVSAVIGFAKNHRRDAEETEKAQRFQIKTLTQNFYRVGFYLFSEKSFGLMFYWSPLIAR